MQSKRHLMQAMLPIAPSWPKDESFMRTFPPGFHAKKSGILQIFIPLFLPRATERGRRSNSAQIFPARFLPSCGFEFASVLLPSILTDVICMREKQEGKSDTLQREANTSLFARQKLSPKRGAVQQPVIWPIYLACSGAG